MSDSNISDTVVLRQEVTRMWNPIPNVKVSYTDNTKTCYHQGWPFNK